LGTDGPGVYDNDGAADTVLRIEREGFDAVVDHLERVNGFGDDPVWSNVAEEGLPAVDVVAHLVSGVPALGSMIEEVVTRLSPGRAADLVEPASLALDAIERPGSGLRELWEKSAGGADEWLATLDDLRRRLHGEQVHRDEVPEPSFAGYRPGDVVVVELRGPVEGIDGLCSQVIIRSRNSGHAYEVFVLDVFLPCGHQGLDDVSMIEPRLVAEGWQVVINPWLLDELGRHVGHLDGFELADWPMLIDDRSIRHTSNPYPIAERHFDESAESPVFTPLELPPGETLESVGRDYFDRPWVPFTDSAATPGAAAGQVWYRYRGDGTPFEGNARQQIIRTKRRK
jgi:hypothetical protein